ncbi:MAG: hypothetical protein J0H40_13595 [Rhizobiales bacterium]|nr:hypothetical protein [Hyphomicrobiales bacterium]
MVRQIGQRLTASVWLANAAVRQALSAFLNRSIALTSHCRICAFRAAINIIQMQATFRTAVQPQHKNSLNSEQRE